MITATSSMPTSVGDSMSRPSPPTASPSTASKPMTCGAGAWSLSREAFSAGIGSFSAVRITHGRSRRMSTPMIVSSGVSRRSSSRTGTALSQQTATRAPWSLKGWRSSWAV